MTDALSLDTFLPKTAGNYFAPRVVSIPTGTTYEKFTWSRPVIMIALTPATVGTMYAYPNADPLNDNVAIPTTAGILFLDAIGTWHIRHTGAGTEQFRVIDAGGAGNASGVLGTVATSAFNLQQISGTAQTALDLTARYVAPTTFTGATPFATTAGDSAMLAALAARKMLSATNIGTSWAAIGAKASALTGLNDAAVFFILPPNSSYTWQQPAQAPPVAAIRVYTSGALSTIYMQEGS